MLVDRYTRPLLGYLRKVSGSDTVADELHQATWLSALQHLNQFDPKTAAGGAGGFKAWLFRIATNKGRDHFRRVGRERRGRERMGDDPAFGSIKNVPDPSGRLDADERAIELRQAIANLPEPQREVVMLRFYGGLKFIEIAETLGCPLNTALGRMHKAMNKLKAALGADEP